jgi:hypothetical protein
MHRVATEGAVLRRGELSTAWRAVAAAPPGRLAPSEWRHVDPLLAARVAASVADDRGRPWPQPRFIDYAAYVRTGDRVAYESAVAARLTRLTRAVVAAATGDDAALGEIADGLWLLCEQSTWCWPAHDDAFTRNGTLTPDLDRPCLDLGAGEAVAALAWAVAVHGVELERRFPGLVDRARREAEHRVFAPFRDRRWHWEGLDGHLHNWNPWIHGNLIAAAAALLPEEEAMPVIDRAVDGIDRYLAALPGDGAIDEGWEYWWNGAGRALEAIDLLDRLSGGALDLDGLEGLDELLRFPLRMQLAEDWYVNVADAQARGHRTLPWDLLHRWGRRRGLPDVTAYAAAHQNEGEPVVDLDLGLGRVISALGDVAWREAAGSGSLPLPRTVELASVQLVLARERDGSSAGLAMTLKGGHNDENHNHNDLGSVIVALDGEPVIVDPGRPTYEARTFTERRYEIWTMRSDWHSVPRPRGLSQPAGRDIRALEFAGGDDGVTAEWSVELRAAYGLAEDESWHRTATLDRAAGRVTIGDHWRLDAAASADPTTVVYLVWGDVSAEGDEVLRIRRPTGSGRDALLRHDGARAHLEVRALDDAHLQRSWGVSLTRITLHPAAGANGLRVTVEPAP